MYTYFIRWKFEDQSSVIELLANDKEEALTTARGTMEKNFMHWANGGTIDIVASNDPSVEL